MNIKLQIFLTLIVVIQLYLVARTIKINKLSVKPFEKDKKILISKLNLRLYAHTSPEEPKDIVNNKD